MYQGKLSDNDGKSARYFQLSMFDSMLNVYRGSRTSSHLNACMNDFLVRSKGMFGKIRLRQISEKKRASLCGITKCMICCILV